MYDHICLICQQDKVAHKVPGGLLSLPVAEKLWDNVTMDFIICLPYSEVCGMIMVVVDRFSKYTTFTATMSSCIAKEVSQLFLKNFVKL